MSNICFLLSCLMIPLSFGLIDLQSTLPLTGTEHTVFEVLIVLVIFWLIWQINRLDRWLYLHYFSSKKKNSLPHTPIEETGIFIAETSMTPDCAGDKKQTGEIEKPGSRPTIELFVRETQSSFNELVNRNGQ
jgi:hypothetical protein